MGLNRDFFEK